MTAVLGTLMIIAAVIAYAIISSLLNNLFISMRYGESAVCALLPLAITCIFIAFIVFDVIFILWQIKITKKGDDGDAKFNRFFKIILIISLVFILVLPLVSSNMFTKLDETAISKVFFAEYKSYDIKTDISRSTLACSADGKLTYTVTMTDGEKFELLGSVNSCGDGFIKEYENLYGYAAHITDIIASNGNPPRIIGEEYMESVYKEAHPEIWKYLNEMINTSKQ